MIASDNPFAGMTATPKPEKQLEQEQNPFEGMSFQEPWYKSFLRWGYQIPSGIAKAFTFPADIIQMMGVSEAMDPDNLDLLREIHLREGIPFDEEAYLSGVSQAAETFPTQSNVERMVEESTGAPLVPRTKGQKLLNLASTAGTFAPSTLTQRAAAAVTAPTVSAGAQALGVPEPIADVAGLGVSGLAAAVTPGASIAKATGESVLPIRRFEKTTKPIKVSEGRLGKINEKLEGDFRGIAEDIFKKSEVAETYNSLKSDPAFERLAGEQFQKVQDLASQMEGRVPSKSLKSKLADKGSKKVGKGISPSEYQANYQRNMKKFVRDIEKADVSASQLVEQYRTNNAELRGHFEPGKSRSFNKAKKDALLDYNNSIADIIEKDYPDSGFSDLFKESNKTWSEIKGVELMEGFIDDFVSGKVDFKKGDKFYRKEFQDAFKNSLGKEAFKDFDTLVGDLMGKQQSLSLLKTSNVSASGDLAKTFGYYLLNPKLAAARHGFKKVNSIYQTLLDKPQLSIRWDKGIKEFKKGNVDSAEKIFTGLDKEITALESARSKALAKFRDNKS